jgi:hypothetical protein
MREPILTALLIVEVLLIFVALPLEANDQLPSILLAVVVILFLITSLLVAIQSRVAMTIFAAAAILSLLTKFIHETHYSMLTAWFDVGARHTAICAVSWVIVKIVFGPGRLSVHRIEAAIVVYLNIGLFFFTTYRFLLTVEHDAFSLTSDRSHLISDLLFFSFATMVSTGYAGITPVSTLARSLVAIQSLLGLFYPALLLIRFFTLHPKQSDPSP